MNAGYPDYEALNPAEYDSLWRYQATLARLIVDGHEVNEKCVIAGEHGVESKGEVTIEIREPVTVLLHELAQSGVEVSNSTLLPLLQRESSNHPGEMTAWFLELAQAQRPPHRTTLQALLGRPLSWQAKWVCGSLTPVARTSDLIIITGMATPLA